MARLLRTGIATWLALAGVVAHAADGDDAELARQCPAMSTWIQVAKAERAAAAKVDASAKPGQPTLRTELLKMAEADQQARATFMAGEKKDLASMQVFLAADARNLPRIKQVVAEQGFPTLAQVGRDGVEAAWLLVQHADQDPAFQMQVLDDLQTRSAHGGISAQNYALLVDRVLIAQHQPQRYGTQYRVVDGKLQPDPTEDPANVDKRRAAAGLPPLADYECVLRVSYKLPAAS